MDARHMRKLQEGRKRYQNRRKIELIEKERGLFEAGMKEIGTLTKREVFLSGVVLYWAEGFKHKNESGLGLATADFKMAEFYVRWLELCFGFERGRDLIFRVTANVSHLDRIDEIESFWSGYLEVERSCFSKPFFQRTRWKKSYPDRGKYYGVLRIRLRKSKDALRKMRGWLEGISGPEVVK